LAENTFDYSTLSQTVTTKKDKDDNQVDAVSTSPNTNVTSNVTTGDKGSTFDYSTLSQPVAGTVLGIKPVIDTSVSDNSIDVSETTDEGEGSFLSDLSGKLQDAYENLTGPIKDQPVAQSNLRGFIDPFSQMPGFFKGENEGDRRAKLREEGKVGEAREDDLARQAEEVGYEDIDLYIEEVLAPSMVKQFRGAVTNTEYTDPLTGEVRVNTRRSDASPIIAKMLEIAPVWGYKALMVASDAISIGVANVQDLIEDKVTDLQADDPKIYDKLNTLVAGNFADAVGLGSRKYSVDNTPKLLSMSISDSIGAGLEFSETLPFVGAIGRVKGAAEKAYRAAAKNIIAMEKIDAIDLRRNNYAGAALALREANETARLLAESVKNSAAGTKITEQMIEEFEVKINVGRSSDNLIVIHRVNDKGKKVLDDDLAKEAGDLLSEETYTLQNGTVKQLLDADKRLEMMPTEFAHLATGSDSIMKPILNSRKFDGIVAVATKLKEKYPNRFNNKKTVIQNLYELTVSKDMMAGEELIDMLNDYGLSFEDYVLTVVGSGSEAGKILQKLSVISRSRPGSERDSNKQKALIAAQGNIRKAAIRFEGIRRGLLVSQLATASRNLTSAYIRAPMEGLGNVMDEALYQTTQGNYGTAVKSLSPIKVKGIETGKGFKGYLPIAASENWKDSFRHLKYMFSDPDTAKGYTDLILGQPQLEKQFDLMYNNLNEIQKSTGRGSGGKIDTLLSALEDGTDFLNTPNRWQEYLIRRGQFFGELQRLTRREYGIDLIDTLQDGKLRDLLNDAGGFKPKDARSFLELVDDSTRRALDVTYAKQPDLKVFRDTSNFITRNGLTVIMPFPRFMFNSMELMGQAAGGASIPLAKKVSALVNIKTEQKLTKKEWTKLKKDGGLPPESFSTRVEYGKKEYFVRHEKDTSSPLTAKDRQRISRNIMGFAAVGAAIMYRTSDDAPADYKGVSVGENAELDTTPQFPLRQYLWMGEAIVRLAKGTFGEWYDSKEAAETFIGTNIRAGSSNAIIEEVAALIQGETDLTTGEALGKAAGGAVGNYLSTWGTPYNQLIEAQRAGISLEGTRGLEYKQGTKDPVLDFPSAFMSAVQKPLAKYVRSPEEEAALPNRITTFGGVKSRVAPAAKVVLGFNISSKDKEEGEYLSRLGFQDWKTGSTSRVPSVRNAENAILTDLLPEIVGIIKAREVSLRKRYKSFSDDSETKRKLSGAFTDGEDAYVSKNLQFFVKEQFKNIKAAAAKPGGLAGATPYVRAMIEYRRLPPDLRTEATLKFREFDRQENGKTITRSPDPTNARDLKELVIIAKKLREAY